MEKQDQGRLVLATDAKVGELAFLVLKNIALSVLTLSIYRFWGKTEIRRYLWSRTTFMGERLEYTGTGKELFLGFVFVVLIVLIPFYLLSIGLQELILMGHVALGGTLQILLFATIFYLIGVALYRVQRYRLSRTTWRGIRFSLAGSEWNYGWRVFGYMFAQPLSLNLVYPAMQVNLWNYRWNNTRFGNKSFRHEGISGPLYPTYLMVWFIGGLGAALVAAVVIAVIIYLGGDQISFMADELSKGVQTEAPKADGEGLSLAILALSWLVMALFGSVMVFVFLIYKVREIRYLVSGLSFEGIRFRAGFRYWSLVWLVVGNILIRLLTLGLGGAFEALRTLRFLSANLEAVGEQDFAEIAQGLEPGPKVGEGLAEAFDPAAF